MRISLVNTLLALIFLSGSCGIGKEEAKAPNQPSQEVLPEVSGTIILHNDYCGGMRPTEEILAHLKGPWSGKRYLVFKFGEHALENTPVDTLTCDSDGKFSLQLKEGTYALMDESKRIPYEDFYNKQAHVDNDHYMLGSDECYKQWWSSPDFILRAREGLDTTFVKRHHCFVVDNPCDEYKGPYPP